VARLDRRKYVFDVLEHVLGGVRTSSDAEQPFVIVAGDEAARDAIHPLLGSEVKLTLELDEPPLLGGDRPDERHEDGDRE
jgi:hypothetical protein